MFGVWSFLRQFMYTKFIIVTDDDVERARLEGSDLGAVDARRPGAATSPWSRTRRSTTSTSPARCPASVPRSVSTPPASGRARPRAEWGRPIAMTPAVKARVDALWAEARPRLTAVRRQSAGKCPTQRRGDAEECNSRNPAYHLL
ncbi:MAG: hypothetical protein MZV65_13395 [Chromatiales bacterium]|nr:hypothetical protein [Chromatiales bacterium]